MRELIYTLLDLEKGSRKTCDFCSNPYGEDNKSVRQIMTRIKANGKYVADDVVCENCEEKFLNDELLKCKRCGRLQTKHDIDFSNFPNKEYICYCIRYNENLEEKELPSVPYESQATFYERQINALQVEKMLAETTIEEEREAHEDFMRVSEEWGKRQKQELLDEIKRLKKEVGILKEENKKLVSEELVKEIEDLKKQLEQANQQLAQIEVPPKENKIKNFFKFGGKK